jgi:DNA-binding HxlR family transcriptional regulator
MASVPAEPRPCSIARTLDIVGEKWALLAVREVFLGNRRFDEMVHRTGAPRDTLAARLRTLVGAGILERRRYHEHPARFEYHLTDAGRDLYPVIVTLMRWGDQHLAGDNGPPLLLEHHCGHQLTAQVVCQACGEPLNARDTHPVGASLLIRRRLPREQLRVGALQGHQLLTRPGLHQVTRIRHVDPVRRTHRREPARDQQHRTPGEQLPIRANSSSSAFASGAR